MDRSPTFTDEFVFQAKATIFRGLRGFRNRSNPNEFRRWPLLSDEPKGRLWAESRSSLWNPDAPHAERVLQAGKVQNLRVAAQALDGCRVPANRIFSFWRQVGFPGRWKGYVRGRELRQGCLVPTIAGGLCQLSNALYDVALQAGCTIHERHAHSMKIPGSATEAGRDATVFWNYVDLRFSAPETFSLRITMTPRDLLVRLCGEA